MKTENKKKFELDSCKRYIFRISKLSENHHSHRHKKINNNQSTDFNNTVYQHAYTYNTQQYPPLNLVDMFQELIHQQGQITLSQPQQPKVYQIPPKIIKEDVVPRIDLNYLQYEQNNGPLTQKSLLSGQYQYQEYLISLKKPSKINKTNFKYKTYGGNHVNNMLLVSNKREKRAKGVAKNQKPLKHDSTVSTSKLFQLQFTINKKFY